MDRTMQVKQYVAQIETSTSCFRVFTTGDPKYYLFAQVNPKTGCDTGLQFPVEKARLKKEIRSALSHGVGFQSQKGIVY